MKNSCAKISSKRYTHVATLFGLTLSLLIAACGSDQETSTGFNSSATKAYLQHYSELEGKGFYANSTHLKEVSFSSSIPKNELIQCLEHRNLRSIEILDLTSFSFSGGEEGARSLTTPDLIRLLPRFVNLQNINLQGHGYVSDEVLRSMAPLQGITKLNVNGCFRITDAALATIGSFRNLTDLDINGIDGITDAGVGQLVPLDQLSKLALGGSQGLTLACIEHMTGMNRLVDLSLERVNLTLPDRARIDASLLIIAQVTSRLSKLSLKSSGQITDEHLELLGRSLRLDQLTDLNLEGSGRITDAGLDELHALRRLERLTIGQGLGSRLITRAAVDRLLRANPRLDASLLFRYETLN